MSKTATRILGVLLLTCLAAVPALAAQYPPGPTGTCLDSVSIPQIQNPASACHVAVGDTVFGLGGIITGFDTKTSGVGFYIELSGGGPWNGLDIFTANTRFDQAPYNFARGDSVIIDMGQATEFSNETECTAANGSFGTNISIRRISSGNPLPPFHNGTVNELNQSPANPNAEQWEGTLTHTDGPLRVARITVGATNFVVVDNVICPPSAVGPCDSMFVDGGTLANPSYGQPALGTVIQWLQGIFGQSTSGYRVRLRDSDDILAATPPNVADAYSVAEDTVRVVFDRDVTQATAENTANYTLGSFGSVDAAAMDGTKAVMLAITNGLGHGVTETVNVSNIVSTASGLPMPSTQSRTFWNGVVTMAEIQAADPAFLSAVPCLDRSLYAGTGSAAGTRVSMRGVAAASYPTAAIVYLTTPSATTRGGVAMYGTPMTVGNQYLFVGQVQEYFEETEGLNNVYLRDEGPASLPAPIVQTIAVLRDSSCDATQSYLSGEDYEGMLVKVMYAKIVSPTGGSGFGFDIAGPGPAAFPDSIHVTNRGSAMYTFTPDSLEFVDVTGILSFSFGEFIILPRSDADLLTHGFGGVGDKLPARVSLAVSPNPARTARVTFALPRQSDVDLSVYDLAGRKVATLARGTLSAGEYSRQWSGGAGAGVYFVRLRVGSETYNVRTVTFN